MTDQEGKAIALSPTHATTRSRDKIPSSTLSPLLTTGPAAAIGNLTVAEHGTSQHARKHKPAQSHECSN
jgi:hypothetical protein